MTALIVALASIVGIVVAPVPPVVKVLGFAPILVASGMWLADEILTARANLLGRRQRDTDLAVAALAKLRDMEPSQWEHLAPRAAGLIPERKHMPHLPLTVDEWDALDREVGR